MCFLFISHNVVVILFTSSRDPHLLRCHTINLAINLLHTLKLPCNWSDFISRLFSAVVGHLTNALCVLLWTRRPVLCGVSSVFPSFAAAQSFCPQHFISYVCLWILLRHGLCEFVLTAELLWNDFLRTSQNFQVITRFLQSFNAFLGGI